ncbi:hypothetical protein KKH36_02370 [Patescibacteria group bacterium]|nr:hypothetical protein [Patescibacteria group bacterium]
MYIRRRFSKTFINKISFILPLETVISGEGVELLPKGKELITLCPFHKEINASFTVVPHKQIYRCFGCGESGGIFSFIMKYKGLDFIDTVIYLCEEYGISYPKHKQRKRKKRRNEKNPLPLKE